MDFSEDFTCMEQDEIQSGHWAHPNVTLFTYSVWLEGTQHPGVLTSDSSTQAKETVVPFMDIILEKMPSSIKTLMVFTDGPSSQFKNGFILSLVPALEKRHEVSIEWNYFARSHGKGPADGIGGSTKRYVWTSVRSGKSQVMNSISFAAAASTMNNVNVEHVPIEEVARRAKEIGLASILSSAPNIPGIRKVHAFLYVEGELRTANLSCELDTTLVPAPPTEKPVPGPPAEKPVEKGQFVTAVYEDQIYVAQVEEAASNDLHIQLSFM